MTAEENGTSPVPVLREDPFEDERHWETNQALERDEADLAIQRDRWFYGCVVCFMLSIALGVGWRVRPVVEQVPFVQVITLDSSTGQMTLMETPTPLKDFTIPGEVIRDMLVRFVDDWRRMGKDGVEAKARSQYFYARVCGVAGEQIKHPPMAWQLLPSEERPTLIDLTIPSVLPTDSPRTWRAQWTEHWKDAKGTLKSTHRYMADLTVSRYETKGDVQVTARNLLGICVSSITPTEVP